MKTSLISVLLLTLTVFSSKAQAPTGKQIFSGSCQACHSIGGGDILGPDLAGVTERREEAWIKSFVLNSQKMVKEGDETAVALFEKYNKIAMPSHNFSDEELNNLISYLGEASTAAPAAAPAEADASAGETDQAQASDNEGPGIWVQLILAFLSIAAIALSIMAFYLARLLKN